MHTCMCTHGPSWDRDPFPDVPAPGQLMLPFAFTPSVRGSLFRGHLTSQLIVATACQWVLEINP